VAPVRLAGLVEKSHGVVFGQIARRSAYINGVDEIFHGGPSTDNGASLDASFTGLRSGFKF
jgi:hypothetical protein